MDSWENTKPNLRRERYWLWSLLATISFCIEKGPNIRRKTSVISHQENNSIGRNWDYMDKGWKTNIGYRFRFCGKKWVLSLDRTWSFIISYEPEVSYSFWTKKFYNFLWAGVSYSFQPRTWSSIMSPKSHFLRTRVLIHEIWLAKMFYSIWFLLILY